MKMSKLDTWKCCLCGAICTGWGNDPWPLDTRNDTRCCDSCNSDKVIPARMAKIYVTDRKES